MTGLEVTLLTTLGVLYFAMLFFLGIATLRNGRIALFVLGLFFPLAWIVGAVMPPSPALSLKSTNDPASDRLYSN